MGRLFLIAYILVSVGTANCQWQQTLWISDIHCFGLLGSKLFAGSNNGIIISNDSGDTWSQGSSVGTRINSLINIGKYLIAGNGLGGSPDIYKGIYRSSDEGASWLKMNTQSNDPLIWALATTENGLVAGSFGQGFLISTDSGANWRTSNEGLKDTNIVILNFAVTGTNVFASTARGGVFRSTDNGITWRSVIPSSAGDPVSDWHVAVIGKDVIATATYSEIGFLSTDSGATWATIHIPQPNGYSGANIQALAVSGSNIFAGYTDAIGGITLSTDTGKTWYEIGRMHRVNSLFIFGDYIFAGTNNTGVYRARLSDFIEEAVHLPPQENSKFTILSNPITSSANFQFDALKESSFFELFDLLGRSLLRQQLSAGQAALHLDMQKYPAGIYFARLGGETVRFVKM